MKDYDIIIIGGGAAGLIAAGRAGELGAKVLLIEKMRQTGRKLLITGKGRCNITNDSSMEEYFKNIFPNGRFLRTAFYNFFTKDIVQLINANGVKTLTERGNRVFPVSNKSSDVLKAIHQWVNKYSVDFLYNSRVTDLIINDNKLTGVKAETQTGNKIFHANAVIIATGGKSYPATGSSGDGYQLATQSNHNIIPARPALVPLVCSANTAGKLQGLSLKNVNASLFVNGKKIAEEFGEMLFAHFGLTGPIILTLSRKVVDELNKNNKVEISLDLKTALDEQKLDNRLIRDLNDNGKKQLENIFKLWMPQKLIPVFLELSGIDGKKAGHQMTAKERKKLLNLFKNFTFKIDHYRGFKEAIITAGGIDLREINSKTMESKKVSGLYFAGEVIDLDANTGGFNLQIAFSTGWLAGESAAKK